MFSGRTPCQFFSAADSQGWDGALISNNAFAYRYSDAIEFSGTFPGAQSASGTYRVNVQPSGGTRCDTGVVRWTATTTATPPPGTGPGAPGNPGTGSGPHSKFATRVVLRKLSQKRAGGRITSPNKLCVGRGRTVILWRGSRRIASTKTRADGSYWFARTAAVRKHRVRASVPATALCAAGSSKYRLV
jgi:hypothetical protein